MNVYKVIMVGILSSFSALLIAAETVDHSQHEQTSKAKSGYQASESKDGLNMLTALPKSGEGREAGFDERYAMEPTSAQDNLAELCAKASRGLIMLDRETWQKCGGTPKGSPEMHDSKQQSTKDAHQH